MSGRLKSGRLEAMKSRGSRVLVGDQHSASLLGGASIGLGGSGSSSSSRNKSDSLAVTGGGGGGGGSGGGGGGGGGGGSTGPGSSRESRNANQLVAGNQQPTTAQAIRKRRSSINVYDQPSSLNSRLRQLETDMLRLDEDRSKLHDDTHSVLAQYELRLSEIHAILKSRQDNVDKYVEDMRLLLQAKEEFEKQTKLLNEKHDRIHEKFMHRETTISREIKLLKNKFELLEKSRQFRSILQKSNAAGSADLGGGASIGGGTGDDSLALDSSMNDSRGTRSEATSEADSYPGGLDRTQSSAGLQQHQAASGAGRGGKKKSVQIKLSKLHTIGRLIAPLFNIKKSSNRMRRRRSNRVSSVSVAPPATANNTIDGETTAAAGADGAPAIVTANDLQQEGAVANHLMDAIDDTTTAPAALVLAGKKMKQKKRGLFKRILNIR